MTVGIRIKRPGVTQEQFNAAHEHINPERTAPKGLVFHASGPIDDGWGVAAAGVQMAGLPDVKEFPVQESIQR